jgi:hypothetical protein
VAVSLPGDRIDHLEAPGWARWIRRALEPFVGAVPDLAAAERLATADAGLHDFGDPWHRDGLRQILDNLGEARLNALGRMTLRTAIVRSLGQRLTLVQARKESPAALTRPVRRPIVIAALPRTGSSLLHRLLAAHPDVASVPLWLGIRPLPVPDPAEWARGGSPRRRRAAENTVRSVRIFEPAMFRKHDIGADQPVECAYLMMSTFQAVQWWAVWPLYAYGDWLPVQDPAPPCRVYRETLQLLQAGRPTTGWVLKSPGHMGALEALADELPEAVFVQLHRDPTEVLASTHSLFATAQGLMTDHLDLARAVQVNTRALHHLARRAVDAREALDPARCVDVPYARLVAEPLAVVEALVGRVGLRWDAEVRSAIAACLAVNRQHRFGTHRYALADFGQTDAEVAPGFAEYRRRFGT